ncbi:MAG: hypothetical protein S4CHLAM2_17150 [Chlamydiales bacterium]|nr:hypothetical protein [Chlamydiales bacterium]
MNTLLPVEEKKPCLASKPHKEGFDATQSSAIEAAWEKIAPFWSLENLIAVNPLQGFEDLPFEEAVKVGESYFQQKEIPQEMEAINRETIKWCQAFLDQKCAYIPMPMRQAGLYAAWRQLCVFDRHLHQRDPQKKQWLETLTQRAEDVVAECLKKLSIPVLDQTDFLTLLLTTLPGWAAYIKCLTDWNQEEQDHPITQTDYLAMRLVIVCLLWPEGVKLLDWHQKVREKTEPCLHSMQAIAEAEKTYHLPLLNQLAAQASFKKKVSTPAAQLVFCIDVRSEPFRRALEATGDYETFGFAGFFGLPIQVKNSVSGCSHASCPVLIKPKYTVNEAPFASDHCGKKHYAGYAKLKLLKHFYTSLKHTFSAPFALVETLGLVSGIWMGMRTLVPGWAKRLKRTVSETICPEVAIHSSVEAIAFVDQCQCAEGALRAMGLTKNFAPLVVFCGHGSATQNNAFATALDCGACGGRHGSSNARVLAEILNHQKVRAYLAKRGISIPASTRFMGAQHITTTDAVTLYLNKGDEELSGIARLKADLQQAQKQNSQWRAGEMGFIGDEKSCVKHTDKRSFDWAQVRPEWGLARNAAFIVAPRALTQEMDLEGRCFLHSYNWQQDTDGASLTTILTAPMVVGQWINSQYLFSTLDNVAYGGGSKVTKNITGGIGVMQGNGSDLMHGLPLQSVYRNDREAYHQPSRLMTVVYAPRVRLEQIVSGQIQLQKLFGNGWVTLCCLDPEDHSVYIMERDFSWRVRDEDSG